eukprot:TRINITY_DN10279_c0_g1_i1.p1 TRINITY_DN10279_c0_g1~~TRINITY_DN10279_c0_g1_i1.p1  ORF type:complete len:412 (-),score=72.90 TRINITY_DN10279_c0_g1_i1:148-1383(-)
MSSTVKLLHDVFADDATEHFPYELNTTEVSKFLDVNRETLSIHYKTGGNYRSDVGAIQSLRPFPMKRMAPYYEIRVISGGSRSCIGIGLADKGFNITRQPGWDPNSYGYHGDDGKKFTGTGRGEPYGPTYSTGDIIGCGFIYRKRQIFFTKNGRFLGVAFENVEGELYPSVGLHSENEAVEINLGQKAFRFDIEGFVEELREEFASEALATSLSLKDVHELVRQQLLYCGYQKTLSALSGESQYATLMEASLPDRSNLRQLMISGELTAAIELLHSRFPGLLRSHTKANFLVSTQLFIELIRNGRTVDAVACAQSNLSQLRDQKGIDQDELEKVVALLAYPDPSSSPFSGYLSIERRSQVADAANAMILEHFGYQPMSCLEVLMRQLNVAHQASRDAIGNRGEILEIKKYI